LIIIADSIGVAVIGGGMAGRSHAHAYRTAETVFGTDAPPVRLVAIADVNTDFANHTRNRYGFERTESSWQAIAGADGIDAVHRGCQSPAPRDRRSAVSFRQARAVRSARLSQSMERCCRS
jgi:hypothetical protein